MFCYLYKLANLLKRQTERSTQIARLFGALVKIIYNNLYL